jgi:hypothetical protein
MYEAMTAALESAFVLSGRFIRMVRMPPASVTITWSVMNSNKEGVEHVHTVPAGRCGAIAGTMKLSFQAARSIGFKSRVNGLVFLFARRHDFERTIRQRTLKL